MESIMNKIAIIGMGCTQFGELWDKGPTDLIVDACTEALEDAGLEGRTSSRRGLQAWYPVLLVDVWPAL